MRKLVESPLAAWGLVGGLAAAVATGGVLPLLRESARLKRRREELRQPWE